MSSFIHSRVVVLVNGSPRLSSLEWSPSDRATRLKFWASVFLILIAIYSPFHGCCNGDQRFTDSATFCLFKYGSRDFLYSLQLLVLCVSVQCMLKIACVLNAISDDLGIIHSYQTIAVIELISDMDTIAMCCYHCWNSVYWYYPLNICFSDCSCGSWPGVYAAMLFLCHCWGDFSVSSS